MRGAVTARRRTEPRAARPHQPSLFSLAGEGAIDAGKFEQLIGMEERRVARDAELGFIAAFAELSAELPVIDEHGVIRHGDQVVGTYAVWEDINEAIRPILIRFGFALSFRVSQDQDSITVTALLSHKGGHRESTALRLPPDSSGDKNSVQAVGSSVSYGKRYAATALLNLTSRGEDDDGRRAQGCITQEQLSDLEAKLIASGADLTRLLRYLRVEALNLIPAARLDEALNALTVKALQPRRRA